MITLHHFVGGRPVAGRSGRFGELFDPATGECTSRVPLANAEDVGAAARALSGWSAIPAVVRARVLFRFKSLIDANFDELGGLIVAQHGKVLSDARGCLTRGLEVVEFACGIPHLMKGEFSENV